MSETDFRKLPVDWVEEGDWPDGRLSLEAPLAAALVQGIAARLRDDLQSGIDGQTTPATPAFAAEVTDLFPGAIIGILSGTTWPDVETVAKLEAHLYATLWGNEHVEHFIAKFHD